MEEQRIGLMYVNLFKRWLMGLWGGLFPRGLRRSSALPFIVIVLIVGIPLAAWRLHRRGKFSILRREVTGQVPAGPPPGPMPGGMAPVLLSRSQSPGSEIPEFRSMTLLPGVGLDILQISAFVPRAGVIPLLASPRVEDFANGADVPRDGATDRWGVIEMPWGGALTGVLAPLGTTFRTTWQGHTVEAPVDTQGVGTANGGLLNLLGADLTQVIPIPLGAGIAATFRGTDFEGRWASRNDITIKAEMSARTIDVTVSATNVGEQAEPLGIGWHPRFAIASKNRDAAELLLPGGDELNILDRSRGLPSGRMTAPVPAIARFQSRAQPIGQQSLDANLTHLKPNLLEKGSSVELRDPESQFGIRMTTESASIRAVRVFSPAGANYVSIGAQTNYDDPLGKEWVGSDENAIQTLLPGQTLQWKVRLEIFAVSGRGRP